LLIKNNIINLKFLSSLKKIVSKILQLGGIVFFTFFFILITYYYSSGLNQRFGIKTSLLKINTLIFDRYLGINFLKLDDYVNIGKIKIRYIINKPKIDTLKLDLNQKTVLHLERQRQIKLQKTLITEKFSMHNMTINFDEKKLKAKIRIKGDRSIHWSNRNTSSYKIDMRNDDRIWGLEEFSVQKPIARNYTYEYLFHKFLQYTDHIYLKYFFVNLFFNNEDRGLYAVEESFSKELVERQKKRNGPIFGINEPISSYYPNVSYDLYSSQYWVSQYPKLIKSAYSTLNNLKDDNQNFNLGDHFDLDRWASYFAIIDLTGAYHGSISKSVKLFFNPVKAKFEPIGFDGHYGTGNFDDFILADFLQEDQINCSYICEEKDWYIKFFKLNNGELNTKFIEKYIFYLKKYSNNEFIKKFLEENNKEIEKINYLIYSENSKADKVLWKGIAPFIYDDELLFKRSELIQKRLDSVNFVNFKFSLENNYLIFKDHFSKFPVKIKTVNCKNDLKNEFFLSGNMTIKWKYDCDQILLKNHKNQTKNFKLAEEITISKNTIPTSIDNFDSLENNPNITKISKDEFLVSKNLNILRNTFIPKKQTFFVDEGIQINLLNKAILFVEGNIEFNGSKENKINIKSDGTGSIILKKNQVLINNTVLENLGSPKIPEYILYGGLNIIDSNATINNLLIKSSNSEDAINLVNSIVTLKDVELQNIQSDGIDIDFGTVKFNEINCLNIRNDCLDISGSNTSGYKLNIDGSYDKALSIGENSNVNIKNLILKNSRLGVAVKDGSNVYLENIVSQNNEYDLAVFNKKNEFDIPNLKIKNFQKKNKKILQSKNSKLVIDEKTIFGEQSNAYIKSILY